MSTPAYEDIQSTIRAMYLRDERPWIVGFSGGKDSMMVGSIVFRAIASIKRDERTKDVAVLCTDTRVEIPAIVEMIERSLARMRKWAQEQELGIEVHLLRPSAEQSFWVNILGRGYPPPNRTFRWCTQRMKIDPVNRFLEGRIGRWGEAILLLGARRAESATRAQTLAGRGSRNGLTRHPDMPKVWVANPIEFLSTQEVWAYRSEENTSELQS